MKYFVLEGSFVENHPKGAELEELIRAHLEYLRIGFDAGSILLSGPKAGAGGGVIVLKCESGSDVQDFCKEDPLFQAGIQQYRITEFGFHDCQGPIKYWFD